MVWAHLDDQFPDHPKNEGLTDGAFRLHVAAICYCARVQTDGHLPGDRPRRLTGTFKRGYVAELVAAGAWHQDGHDCPDCAQPRDPGGFYVHGFLGPNDSKADNEKRRREAAERKARWIAKRKADAEAKKAKERSSERVAEHHSEQRPNPTPPHLPPTEVGYGVTFELIHSPEQVATNLEGITEARKPLKASAS